MRLVILGSAAAVPDAQHENTHLLWLGQQRNILIDCPGTPLVRLQQAGLDPHRLTDLVLTHFHPDHVQSVPALLMGMWLTGRQVPLHIHGLAVTLHKLQALLDLYEWRTWEGFYPIDFHELPAAELHPLLESETLRVFSSPVEHMIPNIGLRFELPGRQKTWTYSCDTQPCPAVVRLAKDADLLLHEASGAYPGHSSPAQAGEVASQAGARTLLLIHYPVGPAYQPEQLLQQAR
jgi:ribonuclease Z